MIFLIDFFNAPGEGLLEAPSYYFTKPTGATADRSNLGAVLPEYPQRFSRRARGMGVSDDHVADSNTQSQQDGAKDGATAVPSVRMVTKRIRFRRTTAAKTSHLKSPWLKGRRRPMYRKVVVYIDEHGNEVPGPQAAANQKINSSVLASGVDKKQKSDTVACSKKNSTAVTESPVNAESSSPNTKNETTPNQKRRMSKETPGQQAIPVDEEERNESALVCDFSLYLVSLII
jgi:hypothetical protein